MSSNFLWNVRKSSWIVGLSIANSKIDLISSSSSSLLLGLNELLLVLAELAGVVPARFFELRYHGLALLQLLLSLLLSCEHLGVVVAQRRHLRVQLLNALALLFVEEAIELLHLELVQVNLLKAQVVLEALHSLLLLVRLQALILEYFVVSEDAIPQHFPEKLDLDDVAAQRPQEVEVNQQGCELDHGVNELRPVIIVLKLEFEPEIEVGLVVVVGVILSPLRRVVDSGLATIVLLTLRFLASVGAYRVLKQFVDIDCHPVLLCVFDEHHSLIQLIGGREVRGCYSLRCLVELDLVSLQNVYEDAAGLPPVRRARILHANIVHNPAIYLLRFRKTQHCLTFQLF